MSKKATMRDVRKVNRALVLRHLLHRGSTSRSDAGIETGLSAATVTHVIAELIEDGTVLEQGFQDSEGGRRRTILGINPQAAAVIGVDISDREVTIGIFDLLLNKIAEFVTVFPLPFTPNDAEDLIVGQVQRLLAENSIDAGRVLGLGLGVPGIVEYPTDVLGRDLPAVIHADVIGWPEVTLNSLEKRLQVPVLIDNGAKTTTQGESWFGSAKGVEHAIVVIIGNGAGAGIITNGRLYRGSSSSAGEWGHTKISFKGELCTCGAVGCVETFVAARHVLSRWVGDAQWAGREMEGIDALFAAAAAGAEDASTVIRDTIRYLGISISNLVNLYNPQSIIVGGWLGDKIAMNHLAELHHIVREFSLRQPGSEVLLERSRLRHDAVTLGAAILPLERFIESGKPTFA